MLTSAITAAIAAILSFFGIPPGPYLAGVAIGVKVSIVAIVALLGWRTLKKRKNEASPPESSGPGP
jgi:chromate transport protein ChrA